MALRYFTENITFATLGARKTGFRIRKLNWSETSTRKQHRKHLQTPVHIAT